MYCQSVSRVGAELGGVVVQLKVRPRPNQLTWSQEGMKAGQDPGAAQRVGHAGPYTHMAARRMVSRTVTADPPTGGVQILQQVTAQGGGQELISGQTGEHGPDAFKARP